MGSTTNSANDNRIAGEEFEELFSRRARAQGLLAIKNHRACQISYSGRAIPIPGDLDFKLITPRGAVGYFDTKCYSGDKFPYSKLDQSQVTQACLFNEWRVPSGFIVWFRDLDQVCFYSGLTIARIGPGNSFGPSNGIRLGDIQQFNLKQAMRCRASYGPLLIRQ